MIDPAQAREFLASGRLAVVGVSTAEKGFGQVVYRELRAHGVDVVAVNPSASEVAGDPCYPDLASVPGRVDGVIVMVNGERSPAVVEAAAALGVPRVWLFQGLGGRGAASAEALAACREHGIEVIPGACPLMFLEPVAWFHRVHRAARHLNGSLARTA